MKKVRKKEGKLVKAYCLGQPHSVIEELITRGLLKKVNETQWRLLSQEATEGECAKSGDYLKLDTAGMPYPNTKEFFEKNHIHRGGDEYEQIPKPLSAWAAEDDMCPEVQFLIEKKGLVFNEKSVCAYFKAPLWGDMLLAAKDAVIIFYDIKYDAEKNVTDADFNFVSRSEFEKTYEILR